METPGRRALGGGVEGCKPRPPRLPPGGGAGLPGVSTPREPGKHGGGAWARRVLFPAAPALVTPAPADRPLRWPSSARTGREYPLTPPTLAQRLLGSITTWPHPGARPNCYQERERGVLGRRRGEVPREVQGWQGRWRRRGALRLSFQQKLGVPGVSHRVTTARHPRRLPCRGGQARDGPS